MQYADDVFLFVAPERNSRMWTAENLRDDFGICLRGIDHRDILAMDHDVAHFEVAKIQNAAQHIAVDLHHATFVMMEVDRAAQFFVRGKHLLLVIHVETENPERVTDDELHGRGDGTEQKDDDAQRLRNGECNAIRVGDCEGLRSHFREDQNHGRHDERRINDTSIAEQGKEEACRECRCENVDEVVAEQNGTDQPFAVFGEAQDDSGALVPLFRQAMHPGARRGGKRRFRT